MNDLGQIVGFYVDGAGNTDGLLGTPTTGTVPEPASFAVLGAGLVGAGLASAPPGDLTGARGAWVGA